VLTTGLLLMSIKFLAYYLTSSNAILTDALESIVNVFAGFLALYSLVLSARPKDKNHPYGHGKIEFISSSVEGALILIAGSIMIGKSVYNFFFPEELSNLDHGIWLTAVAGAVNFLLGHLSTKRGKVSNSITLLASGQHLKSDAYSTVGMILGLAIIWFTGAVWMDNVIAIVFGGIIAVTGYRILKKSISGIMDEADYQILEEVTELLETNRNENWVDLHNLRLIRYGAHLHIDAHVTVPWYFSIKEAHEEITAIDQLINQHIEAPVEFFIHTDPCLPFSCKICEKADCQHRQHTFEKRVIWNLENTMENQKHGEEGGRDESN
jgi:cation diffusion facilitator family transporter